MIDYRLGCFWKPSPHLAMARPTKPAHIGVPYVGHLLPHVSNAWLVGLAFGLLVVSFWAAAIYISMKKQDTLKQQRKQR
jgi:hypothetical protein